MSNGRRIPLSNGRKLVHDVIRVAKQMPLAGMTRDLDLNFLNSLRRRTRPRICWNVLMMRAYGLVCAKRPELRRFYLPLPWQHMYEHDKSVCMLTMAREYQGEERLLFARFNEPENRTLADLQTEYDYLRKAPIEEIKQFKHQIRFARCPAPLRRFAWWTLFNVWPSKRASHMGTFGMSFSGHRGAYGNQHLGPNTTTIGVDPRPRKGMSRLLFTFDHRIVDGNPVTEIIDELYHVLNDQVALETVMLLRDAGVDTVPLLAGTRWDPILKAARLKAADEAETSEDFFSGEPESIRTEELHAA